VRKISDFSAILVDDRQGKIKKYAEQDFLCGNDEGVVLTDKGMDCYNAIVTELLKEI